MESPLSRDWKPCPQFLTQNATKRVRTDLGVSNGHKTLHFIHDGQVSHFPWLEEHWMESPFGLNDTTGTGLHITTVISSALKRKQGLLKESIRATKFLPGIDRGHDCQILKLQKGIPFSERRSIHMEEWCRSIVSSLPSLFPPGTPMSPCRYLHTRSFMRSTSHTSPHASYGALGGGKRTCSCVCAWWQTR